MSVNTSFDLLLRGGRVIDPAAGDRRPERRGDPQRQDRRGSIRYPADQRQGSHRRHRQDRLARADRYPRPCLSICHRPLRRECRYGGRPIRRDHPGRSGRPVLHDATRLPAFHCRTGQVAYAGVSVRLSGRRPGRTLLPQPLQPRLRRHRRHREGGNGQPRPRSRHQGPCRNRRLRPLGHSRHRNGGRDRTPRRSCRSTFISASSGGCRPAAPTAKTSTPFSSA